MAKGYPPSLTPNEIHKGQGGALGGALRARGSHRRKALSHTDKGRWLGWDIGRREIDSALRLLKYISVG